MTIPRVFAIGQDIYWMEAIKKANCDSFTVNTIQKSDDMLDCLDCLPEPDLKSLIILDASGQSKIEIVVQGFRNRGRQYVVVVAADPSVKESLAILRKNLGYDYWRKTYDVQVIRNKIERCLDEIEKGSYFVTRYSSITNPSTDELRRKSSDPSKNSTG